MEKKTAPFWRITDNSDPDFRWCDYTWIAPGPTAEDAMRCVVARIKADNARYNVPQGWAPDPIPQVMWAAPFAVPDHAIHMSSERHDVGEDFENMFDHDATVEVRL